MSAQRHLERILAAEYPPFAGDPDLACRQPDVDPEDFHPPFEGTAGRGAKAVKAAKAVCEQCPRKDECLDWAVKTRQRFGVWGATTGPERQAIWTKTEGDA